MGEQRQLSRQASHGIRRLPTLLAGFHSLALLAAVCFGAATSPSTALAQERHAAAGAAAVRLVERYAAALTGRDLPGALALFSEAAGYGGGWGVEHIRSRLARDISVNRWMEIVASRAEPDPFKPDAYVVTFRWRSNEDPFQRLGVPPLEGEDIATVQAGKIVFVTGQLDPASVARRQPAIEAALRTTLAQRWAQATETARATQVARSGVLDRIQDTQARGNQSAALLPVIGIASLLILAVLAIWTKPART